MNSKQKNVILFIFTLILSLGIFAIIILIALKVIDIDGAWAALISLVQGPVISQLLGIWPKIIHYNKVKTKVDEVESMKKDLEEIKKSKVNRTYM